jgi:ring-1,2-phenylacetyl-CoA epoxidase subunit PaaE
MINLVSDTLKENNISDSDIKFELFSTSSNENESAGGNEGHTKISILVDDEETTFEMSQKQTLLEAALKQGLDVPYSCQGGICSSCICRITEGAADMKKNQILSDSEVAEGLTLACQAHPTTTMIKIDFDDV